MHNYIVRKLHIFVLSYASLHFSIIQLSLVNCFNTSCDWWVIQWRVWALSYHPFVVILYIMLLQTQSISMQNFQFSVVEHTVEGKWQYGS